MLASILLSLAAAVLFLVVIAFFMEEYANMVESPCILAENCSQYGMEWANTLIRHLHSLIQKPAFLEKHLQKSVNGYDIEVLRLGSSPVIEPLKMMSLDGKKMCQVAIKLDQGVCFVIKRGLRRIEVSTAAIKLNILVIIDEKEVTFTLLKTKDTDFDLDITFAYKKFHITPTGNFIPRKIIIAILKLYIANKSFSVPFLNITRGVDEIVDGLIQKLQLKRETNNSDE